MSQVATRWTRPVSRRRRKGHGSRAGKHHRDTVPLACTPMSDDRMAAAGSVVLGVEEEFHLVDLETRSAVPRVPELLDELAALDADAFAAELKPSIIETNSDPTASLSDLRTDLLRLRSMLSSMAEDRGLGIVGAGSVPLVDSSAEGITASPRYERMRDEYQMLAFEQQILRHPGARRRPRPRRRRRRHAALRAVAAGPAGALGLEPVLAAGGHRLRQLPHARLAPLADGRPARPAPGRRRLRRPDRGPRPFRDDVRPRDGLLRHAPLGAPEDRRAAHLRRLPHGRRRRPDRGARPRARRARRPCAHRGRPAAALPPGAAARGELARGPLGPGGRPRRRDPARAGAPVAGDPADARPPARGPRGRRRLGGGLRARARGARPGQLRRPPAPAGQPRRRARGRRRHARRRDPRSARRAVRRAAADARGRGPGPARGLPPALLRRGRRRVRARAAHLRLVGLQPGADRPVGTAGAREEPRRRAAGAVDVLPAARRPRAPVPARPHPPPHHPPRVGVARAPG